MPATLLEEVAWRLRRGTLFDGVTVMLLEFVNGLVSSWMLAKNISIQRAGLVLLSRAATQIGLSRAEASLELALATDGNTVAAEVSSFVWLVDGVTTFWFGGLILLLYLLGCNMKLCLILPFLIVALSRS